MSKILVSYIFLALSISSSIEIPNDGSTLQAAAYVMSQNALNDAPYRYANFIILALIEAQNYPVQDMIDVHSCKTSYWIYGSRSTKTFSIVPGTLQINIVSDGI